MWPDPALELITMKNWNQQWSVDELTIKRDTRCPKLGKKMCIPPAMRARNMGNSYQRQRNPKTAHENVQHLFKTYLHAGRHMQNKPELAWGTKLRAGINVWDNSNEAAHWYHSATQNKWTRGKEIRAPKHYTKQRYLKAVEMVDERYTGGPRIL